MTTQTTTTIETQADRWASPRTMQRLRYLLDVTKVDDLLDEFERMGMPMGSDRWAEYCQLRLRELMEKERTLNKLKGHLDEMNVDMGRCGSGLHREFRRRLTADHQKRSQEREDAAMEAHKKSKP